MRCSLGFFPSVFCFSFALFFLTRYYCCTSTYFPLVLFFSGSFVFVLFLFVFVPFFSHLCPAFILFFPGGWFSPRTSFPVLLQPVRPGSYHGRQNKCIRFTLVAVPRVKNVTYIKVFYFFILFTLFYCFFWVNFFRSCCSWGAISHRQ